MEEPIQRNESTTVFLTTAGCVAGLSRKPRILTQSHRKEGLGKSQLSSHGNKRQRTRETPVGHAPEKQLTSETHTDTTDCKKTRQCKDGQRTQKYIFIIVIGPPVAQSGLELLVILLLPPQS